MGSWKEVAPGRFERPFDSIELFFVTLARATASINREHWCLNIAAQFQAPFSFEEVLSRLKNAWIAMRYDHPQIASVAEGDTKVYIVPDPSMLDTWLRETFIVASETAEVEDIVASLRPQSQATIHFLPKCWELLIHTSHWRMDAIGGINFLNNLFHAVAEPRRIEFGDEGQHLSPSRDEVASFVTAGIGGDASQTNRAATDLISTLTNNLPSIGLPTGPPTAMPTDFRRLEQKMDSITTSKVVSACKALNITVTMALHSAIILATQQLAPREPSATTYTSFGIFNLRSSLPAPFNDPSTNPAALYILGLPLIISPSTFMQNASQLKNFYKQPLPPSANSTLAPLVIPYTEGMIKLASSPPHADTPIPTEPMLSSLGVADRYLASTHNDVEITDF